MLDFKIAFRKSPVNKGFYDVLANGAYVGFVVKGTDGKWTNSKDDNRYGTRVDATRAMRAFIVAELAAMIHYANATSEDVERAWYQGEIYMASKATLVAAIEAAYPDMDVDDVYNGWVNDGESIAYVVNRLRQEAIDNAAYQAELDAEEAAYQTQQDAKTAIAAIEATTEPRTRQAAFLVTSESDGSTRVTVGIMSPDMPTDKATGTTKTGIPFNVSTLDYQDAGRAWRMVDTMAKELREWRDPFHVAIEGTRPDVIYQGTVYAGATACCHDQALYPAPTYRLEGFPSLDARIGAGYARS